MLVKLNKERKVFQTAVEPSVPTLKLTQQEPDNFMLINKTTGT